MVRKKRIGNDLVVRWRIKNKSTGEAYDLEGRNLTLTMTCSEMVINVDDYAIIGNTIEFSFLGRRQKYTGLYVLTLVEERGREGLLTLDTKEAFQLVPHSWQENEESDDGALGIETIDLVSEINGGVPGESAYKTACRHGFVGTEQEWLTSLEAKVTRPSIENALGYMPYERPESGIPSTDLAQGVIPDVSNFITKSVDDLTNYYLKEDTYTKAEVAALIGAINQFHYEVAPSLSDITNPQSNVLYLIGPTGTGSDRFEEYVYPDATAGFVKIGDTSIDLSGYVTTSALNTALADYTTTADLTTLLDGMGLNAIEDGVFIMFHRNSDNYPLMVKPHKWASYQSSGESADGVVVVEGGKLLVVAPTEAAESSLLWSSEDVSGGGTTTTDRVTAYSDWNGKTNTAAQIQKTQCQGAGYAPGFCASYSRTNANGYGLTAGKWWLPSMGEMFMIYANMTKINHALSLITGATQLAETWYWTSTERSAKYAWGLNPDSGRLNGLTKAGSRLRVRAVSAFIS